MNSSGYWRWNHGSEELPPRPDPMTGEPFPPRGLAYLNRSEMGSSELDPNRETRLSRRPRPPEGRGPVLVWYSESPRGRVVGFIFVLGLMVALLPLMSLLSGGGPLEAFGYWQMWVLCLATAILTSRPLTRTARAAGADWFMVESTRFGRKKRTWVDLYSLVSVDAMFAGGGFHLTLEDQSSGVGSTFPDVQADRRMWDLIYNGILHSVADGAKISTMSIGVLELDKTPALQQRNMWHRRHGQQNSDSDE